MFHSNFNNRFNRSSKRFNIIFYGVIAVIVLFGGISALFVGKAAFSSDKHLILITYFDNNNEKTAFATEIIEENDRCIKFKNQFGLEEKICAENITYTKYK